MNNLISTELRTRIQLWKIHHQHWGNCTANISRYKVWYSIPTSSSWYLFLL